MNEVSSRQLGIPATVPYLQIITVPLGDRHQIQSRLEELDLPCTSTTLSCLQIELTTPMMVLQLWSVLRRFHASRQQMVDWLEQCW